MDGIIIDGLNAVTLGLAASVLILLIMILFLIRSYIKMKKRLDRFVGARSEKHNIEAMLQEYLDQVRYIHRDYEKTLAYVKNVNERLAFCIQKVGVVRYNPFDNMGGELSFALALLDENDDGVVINTIHGRDASYTYAKPIKASQSEYRLSSEEEEAIRLAEDNYSNV